MNRKILAILTLLIIACGIGAVSALDLGDLVGSDDSGKVTIDGIDFNIPEGFSEEKDLALDGEVNESSGVSYTTWGKTYSKGSDVISIGVATYDGVEVDDTMPSFIGDEEMEVNGVKGYSYDVDPFDGFTYAKNGKLVIISLTDGDMLEDIVLNYLDM